MKMGVMTVLDFTEGVGEDWKERGGDQRRGRRGPEERKEKGRDGREGEGGRKFRCRRRGHDVRVRFLLCVSGKCVCQTQTLRGW